MSNGMLTYEVCPDTIALSRFIVYGEHAKQKKYNQQNSTNSLNRASGIGIFLLFRCCPDPEDPKIGTIGKWYVSRRRYCINGLFICFMYSECLKIFGGVGNHVKYEALRIKSRITCVYLVFSHATFSPLSMDHEDLLHTKLFSTYCSLCHPNHTSNVQHVYLTVLRSSIVFALLP